MEWTVTNANACAVVVCRKYKLDPVIFTWNWGDNGIPIVDQYTYLGADISKYCFWDTHSELLGKGKYQVGRMDAVLADSHLDTRIRKCILICVIVPRREYAGVWEGGADSEDAGEVREGAAELDKQLGRVHTAAEVKKALHSRFSSTTRNTVLKDQNSE